MRLMRAANIVMSNTPSEMRDLLEFRRRVGGEVLISGLGLGITAQIASAKAAVSTVTVIEIFRRRQRLVAPLSPTNALPSFTLMPMTGSRRKEHAGMS
jgi:hypothetical protein